MQQAADDTTHFLSYPNGVLEATIMFNVKIAQLNPNS